MVANYGVATTVNSHAGSRSTMILKGVTWDHPRGYEPLVAASDAHSEQTGIEVAWDKRSLQAFADEPVAGLAEKYDFIVLDHPHVGRIAETGALLPLPKPEDGSASLGGSAESYFWNGECWAYAIDAACQMAAYRPDIDSPRPVHWEDFLDPDAGCYRQITPLLPVDAFDMMMTIVAGRGGETMPHNPEQFVSDDNGQYALNILRALYSLGPDDQIELNPIDILEALTTTDEFSCSPCLFGYVNYARRGFRSHRIEYSDLPLSKGRSKQRSILGGAGIGVSARTGHPGEAIRFGAWLASLEVQSGIYLEGGGQPANRHTWLEQAKKQDAAGFFKGGFNAIDNAWTRPREPWFLDFVDDICDIMPDFFRRNIPTEEFMTRINKLYRHHRTGG